MVHWAWLKCGEAVKTYVAVWGPWSLGLQVCCRGSLGIGLNPFWESGKTHVAVLGPFVPWTGWAWLKCVLEAVKNAGWPFGARGARGALGTTVGLLSWRTVHGQMRFERL